MPTNRAIVLLVHPRLDTHTVEPVAAANDSCSSLAVDVLAKADGAAGALSGGDIVKRHPGEGRLSPPFLHHSPRDPVEKVPNVPKAPRPCIAMKLNA